MPVMARLAVGGLIWGAVLGFALSAGCGGEGPEICTSLEDEDGDGRIGCADDDCWIEGGVCEEICETVHDEDGDGVTGCDDPDCWVPDGGCEEICDSELDEDGDGAVACADEDCWLKDGPCPEICPGVGEDDTADEDGDGAVGCDDPDCWLPDGGCPERCDTESDEDGDGLVGCADEDCVVDPFCLPSFEQDVQPIFLEHCWGQNGGCHSDLVSLGGLSFDSYEDMPLPSNYCGSEVTKAACSLYRILEPSMPQNCLGCVPAADIEVIQAWVDGGIPR